MTDIWLRLVLGLLAGIVSGITGVGAQTIILPAAIYLLGFSQHQAPGTTPSHLFHPLIG